MTFFPPLSFLLMATTTPATVRNREFRFVPYGESFQADDRASSRPTVSCDGRIPGGVSLELTHWTDNKTPDELYADTSTEMALKFAKLPSDYLPDALILNNHYDTDGVLSCWACLHPTEALEYAALLKEGAEAGDFGEWNSDNGVKLDCIVESFPTSDEEEAYHDVLEELPNVLADLTKTGGESYRAMWEEGFEKVCADYECIQEGIISLSRGPGKIVLVEEHNYPSPYALHRGLKESGLTKRTTRILHILPNKDESTFQYRYEMPGYGWVKKLVDRQVIPHVAHKAELVAQLGEEVWTPSGGLTGICHTTHSIETPPDEVASLLCELDDGSK